MFSRKGSQIKCINSANYLVLGRPSLKLVSAAEGKYSSDKGCCDVRALDAGRPAVHVFVAFSNSEHRNTEFRRVAGTCSRVSICHLEQLTAHRPQLNIPRKLFPGLSSCPGHASVVCVQWPARSVALCARNLAQTRLGRSCLDKVCQVYHPHILASLRKSDK